MAALIWRDVPVHSITTKRCTKCREWKTLPEYAPHTIASDGRRSDCRACGRQVPSQAYDAKRAKKLMRRFGLTPEAFADLLAAQGGMCAICPTTEPGGSGTWHVDHDHECCPGEETCGKCVRGLLCARCNVGLGLFGDDVSRLLSAARYLGGE